MLVLAKKNKILIKTTKSGESQKLQTFKYYLKCFLSTKKKKVQILPTNIQKVVPGQLILILGCYSPTQELLLCLGLIETRLGSWFQNHSYVLWM